MIIDPEKLQMLAEAASLTEEDYRDFKNVSELLIELGTVQRLTPEGMIQAVDRLSYEIAKLSLESYLVNPNLSNEEVIQIPDIAEQLEKMDEVMITIAFGSGVHKAIIDLLIAERCDHYVKVIIDKLGEMY